MTTEPPFDIRLPEALAFLPKDDVEAYPGAAILAVGKWGRAQGWPCEVVMGHISGSGPTDAGCMFLECDGVMLDAWGNRRLSKIIANIKRIFGLTGNFYFHGEPQDIASGMPAWLTDQQAHMCHQMLAQLHARDLAVLTAPAAHQQAARRL